MSETYLPNKKSWPLISLRANPSLGYIQKVSTGGTPSTKNEEYWDGDVPWLTPREISSLAPRLYVSHTERTISKSGVAASSAKPHKPNRVMLSKRAPVGLVAINTVDMAANQGFLVFECGKMLRPAYLAHWLRINKKYLDAYSNGSTYSELYVTDLEHIFINIPPLEVQDKILEVIDGIEMMLAIYKAKDSFTSDLQEIIRIHVDIASHGNIRSQLYPLLFAGILDPSKEMEMV